MLRLSTKGRYGVRLMIDLAQNFGKGPVVLKDVAKRQDISVKYLEHLIVLLKQAKLIRATRGARGGYVLSRPPYGVTLKDIITAVEGSVALVDCTKDPAVCKRSVECLSRDVWSRVAFSFAQVLDSFTLESMIHREKHGEEGMTYAI